MKVKPSAALIDTPYSVQQLLVHVDLKGLDLVLVYSTRKNWNFTPNLLSKDTVTLYANATKILLFFCPHATHIGFFHDSRNMTNQIPRPQTEQSTYRLVCRWGKGKQNNPSINNKDTNLVKFKSWTSACLQLQNRSPAVSSLFF